MPRVVNKIKREIRSVKQEVADKTVGYIVTALGLVAGLAWNDAIKSLIEYFFPANKHTLWAKFSYAVLITLVIVLISIYLVKILKKEEKENIKEKTEKIQE